MPLRPSPRFRLHLAAAAIALLGVAATTGLAEPPAVGSSPSDEAAASRQTVETRGDLKRRGRVGASLRAVPPAGDGSGGGIALGNVPAESAAAKAGLASGDLLMKAAGVPVPTIDEFFRATYHVREGEELVITKEGDYGDEQEFRVVLGAAPLESREGLFTLYDAVPVADALARTIATAPLDREGKRYPAVLVIPGYLCHTQELSVAPDEAVEAIVNELGAAGFVVMRAEKPGMGDSLGGYCPDIDFPTELALFTAALRRLKEYEFVDPANVFIFGHSLGGVIGPRIACDEPVKGIAIYGAMGVPYSEYLVRNWRRQFPLLGRDPVDTEDFIREVEELNGLFYHQGLSLDAIRTARPNLAAHLDNYYPGGRWFGRVAEFAQGIQQVHVARSWRDCNARVLSMWGTSDFVSSPEELRSVADIVNGYRPGQGEFVEIAEADHGMFRAASIQESVDMMFRPDPERPVVFNEAVLAPLKEWLVRVAAEQA